MTPTTAEAAAAAGASGYTLAAAGGPFVPKLRLVGGHAHSPSASMPLWPPKQGPHVGVLTATSASAKISRRPSRWGRR